MKADDELYCEIIRWRDGLRAKHALAISFDGPPDRETFFSQVADEMDEAMTACDQSVPALSQESIARQLSDRITNYLASGGLFNPELMEADKVRRLLMDCRDSLSH